MQKSILSVLLILSLFVPGCGTTPQERVQSAAEACELIAYNASEVLLIEKPGAEAGLRIAANELRALETHPQVQMTEILTIVHRFPLDKLKSPYARLAVNNGTLILTRLTARLPETDLGTLDLKPIVTALRTGIEMRIGPPAETRKR